MGTADVWSHINDSYHPIMDEADDDECYEINNKNVSVVEDLSRKFRVKGIPLGESSALVILGSGIVYSTNRSHIVNFISADCMIKKKFEDEPFFNTTSRATLALEDATRTLKVKVIKVSNYEINLDGVSWISIQQIFRQHLKSSRITIFFLSLESLRIIV